MVCCRKWVCSHKSPFIKDTDGTSFSKSGFKIYVICRRFKRLAVSQAGYLQIEDQVPSEESVEPVAATGSM
jgi:hypothetical protein